MPFYNFKGWDLVDGSKVSKDEIEKAFAAVMLKAKKIENTYILRQEQRRKAIRFRAIVAAAAIVVLLIICSITIQHYLEKQHADYTASVEINTSRGEIKEIVLEDGSKVILNAGSTLTYPEKFEKERTVTLEGEALFYVTSSKRHPFTVKTKDINVTAHGTVFNVSNYSEAPTASATLCNGIISVERCHGEGEQITLEPDQALTIEKHSGAITVRKVNVEDAVSWKDGDLRLKSVSLKEALDIVERKFDINIHLTTDKYNSAILTAKFINGESLTELMDALCILVPGMQYQIKDNNIYIR